MFVTVYRQLRPAVSALEERGVAPMRTILNAIVMMAVMTISVGAASNKVSTVELAQYAQAVEDNLHSPRITQTDWDIMAKNNFASLNNQYVILPDKGKVYEQVIEVYNGLKGHSLVPDTMVFHIARTRLGNLATDVVMRDEGQTVYLVEQFVNMLYKQGFLEAVVAHESVHGIDDGKGWPSPVC